MSETLSKRSMALARQIVGVHTGQGQSIIKIQIGNSGFHGKTHPTLTGSQEFK